MPICSFIVALLLLGRDSLITFTLSLADVLYYCSSALFSVHAHEYKYFDLLVLTTTTIEMSYCVLFVIRLYPQYAMSYKWLPVTTHRHIRSNDGPTSTPTNPCSSLILDEDSTVHLGARKADRYDLATEFHPGELNYQPCSLLSL